MGNSHHPTLGRIEVRAETLLTRKSVAPRAKAKGESSYKFARIKLRSETAKSLHESKIVFFGFGQSLNRLSPLVTSDLDKYLSPREIIYLI